MKKSFIAISLVLLSVGLSGCFEEKPKVVTKSLVCGEDLKKLPKQEQMAMADACFRRGSFRKSPERQW